VYPCCFCSIPPIYCTNPRRTPMKNLMGGSNKANSNLAAKSSSIYIFWISYPIFKNYNLYNIYVIPASFVYFLLIILTFSIHRSLAYKSLGKKGPSSFLDRLEIFSENLSQANFRFISKQDFTALYMIFEWNRQDGLRELIKHIEQLCI
jgi:hypothetical protein